VASSSTTAATSRLPTWSASIERVPTVPNSPSPFTAFTKQIKEMVVVDPYTIRFKTAAPIR
jgi:ABC-type transport system substrate-binding protein